MKTEEYTNAAAFLAALHGTKPQQAKQPRRARGQGTGSRSAALNELAAVGWDRYASDDGTHTLRHASGREVTAASYDALLDAVLREVRAR